MTAAELERRVAELEERAERLADDLERIVSALIVGNSIFTRDILMPEASVESEA